MQYKVPQNVQMEDKIVGPLTLRHLIVIGAGGGFAYLVYVILSRTYYAEVWVPPVLIIGLLTLAIAFLKIYNHSFGKFLLLLFEHYLLPRKRKWLKSSAEIPLSIQLSQKSIEIKKKSEKKGKESKDAIKNLKNITELVDTYGEKIESYDKKNNNQT